MQASLLKFCHCKFLETNVVMPIMWEPLNSWHVHVIQSGGEDWKTLSMGNFCFIILRKTMGQAPFVTFPPRLYNSYNHAQAPGQHIHVAESGPPAPGLTPSAPKH